MSTATTSTNGGLQGWDDDITDPRELVLIGSVKELAEKEFDM